VILPIGFLKLRTENQNPSPEKGKNMKIELPLSKESKQEGKG
jgi:hypothetical protein